MKKCYLGSLFLFIAGLVTLSTSAQRARLEWAEKTKFEDLYITTIKSQIKNEFIKISYRPVSVTNKRELAKSLVLSHYDKRLQLIYKKEIPLDEKDLMPVRVISMKGNHYLLSAKHNKSKDETAINLTPIDVANDRIGATSVMTTYPIGSGAYLRIPKYIYSADSGRVLVYVNYIRKKGDNQQFADFVINEKAEKIWEKKFEIQVPGESPLFFSYETNKFREAIANDGNVYLLYSTASGNSGYNLICIDNKGDLSSTPMNLPDKPFFDAAITVNQEGNIVYGGFYKEKTGGNITGYGIYVFDKKTFQPLNSKLSNFEPGFVEKVAADKQGETKAGKFGVSDNFRIKSIVTRSNGDVDFIAEFEETLFNASTHNYFFNVGDILILDYSVAGDVSCFRIPKMQMCTNASHYASFHACEHNSLLYIFYHC